MAQHHLNPEPSHVYGRYSPEIDPVLRITPGDTVVYKTLDAGWKQFDQVEPFKLPPKFQPRDRKLDNGHALNGPVFVEGAEPGMVLELRFNEIVPGSWGWCSAGYDPDWNARFNLGEQDEGFSIWQINNERGVAHSESGVELVTNPFIGNVGMPPAEPGNHSSTPPRFCGGNLDCKELVVGSRLYLPISVTGGLVMLGDGHAVQGDGEIAGPALECPMERVVVEFHLHDDMQLSMPRADTPAGWVTFGFDEDLNKAQEQALYHMLDLIVEQYGVPRVEAAMLASMVVDHHITQVVNGVKGVHAILPHGAIKLKS